MSEARTDSSMASAFRDAPRWRQLREAGIDLWFAGYLHGRDAEDVVRELSGLPPRPDVAQVTELLRRLDGHYALVVTGQGWELAAVDRVRSIPLFFVEDAERNLVHWHAPALLPSVREDDLDPDAALAVGMMGYTIGDDTLHRRITQLRPGEFLYADADRKLRRRHSMFRPWDVAEGDEERFLQDLEQRTKRVFEKLAASAGGRPIVVPLSAGLDSRLVVAGLAEVGYGDVRCFAYGQPRNYEAQASRSIARRLGHRWWFVPLTRRRQRRWFTSDQYRGYLTYADTLCATPFNQDLPAILESRRTGAIPPDAIVVNGQTGDFISGGHLPQVLRTPAHELAPGEREARVVAAYLEKHARLWGHLATPENDERLARRVRAEWAAADVAVTQPETDHALYEYAEFQDRQSKYVINGQRAYEYANLDWRLPLWDSEYLDFWEQVPLPLKAGQRLYRTFLRTRNWAGIFDPFEFPTYTTPRWVVPPVKAARAVHRLAGRSDWPRAERRYFSYWTDVVNNYAMVPYTTVASDRRRHRHAISWHTAAYLRRHGLDLDGRLLP